MTDSGLKGFLYDIQHHIVEVPKGYEASELIAWMTGYNDAIEKIMLIYDTLTEGQKE